ncbi:hypothetical protein QFZ82_001423 [Streptomyces sp. V4I23]|nr:hypothetical protein [Streptomyces sp. V4I23]
MLHAYGELNRAKVRVAAGNDPWLSGWNRLTGNSHSAATWTARPQTTVIRGGTGENCRSERIGPLFCPVTRSRGRRPRPAPATRGISARRPGGGQLFSAVASWARERTSSFW